MDPDETQRKRVLSTISADSGHESVTSFKCTPCAMDNKTDVPAVSYCPDCDEHYCNACKDMHSRLKLLREHVLLDKSALDNPGYYDKVERCDKPGHDQTYHSVYCENHRTTCCPNCSLLEHKDCPKQVIPDAAAKLTPKERDDAVAEMKKLLPECEGLKRSYEKERNEMRDERETIATTIKNFCEKVNTELMVIQRNAEDDLEKQFNDQEATVMEDLEIIDRRISMIKTYLDNFETYKQADRKLFVKIMQGKAFAKDLEDRLPDVMNRQRRDKVKFELDEKLSKVLNNITSLGKFLKSGDRELYFGGAPGGTVVAKTIQQKPKPRPILKPVPASEN